MFFNNRLCSKINFKNRKKIEIFQNRVSTAAIYNQTRYKYAISVDLTELYNDDNQQVLSNESLHKVFSPPTNAKKIQVSPNLINQFQSVKISQNHEQTKSGISAVSQPLNGQMISQGTSRRSSKIDVTQGNEMIGKFNKNMDIRESNEY